MKNTIFLLFICMMSLVDIVNSQTEPMLPQLAVNRILWVYADMPKEYYDNGNLKAEITEIDSVTALYSKYYISGYIQMHCYMTKDMDTVLVETEEDPFTGEYESVWVEQEIWVENGLYKEFRDNYQSVLCEGNFVDGEFSGEWLFYNESGGVKKCTFVSDTKIEYKEFYDSEMTKLRREGAFELLPVWIEVPDFFTGEFYPEESEDWLPAGNWKYYKTSGELIISVPYTISND